MHNVEPIMVDLEPSLDPCCHNKCKAKGKGWGGGDLMSEESAHHCLMAWILWLHRIISNPGSWQWVFGAGSIPEPTPYTLRDAVMYIYIIHHYWVNGLYGHTLFQVNSSQNDMIINNQLENCAKQHVRLFFSCIAAVSWLCGSCYMRQYPNIDGLSKG